MPAKAKKVSPAKKVAPSRVTPRRVAARPVAKPVAKSVARPRPVTRRNENMWTKLHFMEEQNAFFAAHPNSRILLAVFISAVVFYLFIVWTNRADILPQVFAY